MMFYGKCTSGEYNVKTLEQLRTRALWGGGGVGRGSWYVQCNISHTIDSLESPTPFNAAKQATLQCVKKKKALNAASLCVTTQWFSPRSIV